MKTTGLRLLPQKVFFVLALAGLFVPAIGHGQYSWVTNNGAITITGFAGSGSYESISIPETISNLTVVNIGDGAFQDNYGLAFVTIPDTVTNLGSYAFAYCFNLLSVTLSTNVISIGDEAFREDDLLSVTIPNSVINIGVEAFDNNYLTSVVIPSSVTNLGAGPFRACYYLTNITVDPLNPCYASDAAGVVYNKAGTTLVQYPCAREGSYIVPGNVNYLATAAFADASALLNLYFPGNAPGLGNTQPFFWADQGTIYYLPGTTGWTNTYGSLPTEPWYLPGPVVLGMQPGQCGFTISWATNASVVIDSSTNLAPPDWQPMQTNALVNGTNCFSDPNWLQCPACFYRVRAL